MWNTVAVAAALAVATCAQAQTKKELAQQVLELQRPAIESLGRSIAAQPTSQILMISRQALGRLPADKREAVGKAIEADVRAFYADIEPLVRDRAVALAPATIGPLLEERFSDDELKQLIGWLESPVSKKYQELLAQGSNSLQQKVVSETRASIDPKVKALQATLQKRLAAAAPAPPASAPAKK